MIEQDGPDSPSIDVIRPDWPAPANVRAFTTTRSDGFSRGSWGRLNLGNSCGDDPNHVRQNRELLQTLLPSELRYLSQVHGNRVVDWEEASGAESAADAITSHRTGQVCTVLTADCLPVLFCDRAGTQIAASHAGWRGLAGGILEATVSAMGCEPAELMAWLGPAIGPRAYEVGEEVYDAFMALDTKNTGAFSPCGDRWLADLYQLARLTLSRVGVGQVSGGRFCTYSESDKFFSYRRDGVTGRMVSVIWLEK